MLSWGGSESSLGLRLGLQEINPRLACPVPSKSRPHQSLPEGAQPETQHRTSSLPAVPQVVLRPVLTSGQRQPWAPPRVCNPDPSACVHMHPPHPNLPTCGLCLRGLQVLQATGQTCTWCSRREPETLGRTLGTSLDGICAGGLPVHPWALVLKTPQWPHSPRACTGPWW